MSKTKIHEISVEYTPSENEHIPVQVGRSLGSVALNDEKEARRENFRRTHRAQDHGDAAEQDGHFKELDSWEVRAEQKLEDFVLDEARAEATQDDFDAWEQELQTDQNGLDYVSESESDNKTVHVLPELRKYETIMSDLEKIGLTPQDLAKMSDEEKEKLKKWLHKRARK